MIKDKYVVAAICKGCKHGCKVKLHPALRTAQVHCKKQEVK